ncbi:3-hexulose-6-phosphate isomerase [Paenibacillus solanacearum]|uniref:3-hexulose-6-phosphate isomerase n=1 Tax=Paenibacillus solanacearum TaxID=2048548 RepID=A0A916K4R7_9BACL|nr:6-phospho-3-hexuloisomerase [Paenibacillus solanacearum]CAG7630043.1 3-hexulose-6-phosphate isomerase [Paenibacillus solanacearum]
MRTTEYLAEIIKELERSAGQMSDAQAEQLADAIVRANKIFVAGAGRSGLMIRAFAMRLMHMGYATYVVGETVTPGLTQDDLLIIGSGSGETKSLASMAAKAKGIGAAVAAVTIFPESTIGGTADVVVRLPGAPKDKSDGAFGTIQPMGSLFEQTLLLFFDAVILRLMASQKIGSEAMFGQHANLE